MKDNFRQRNSTLGNMSVCTCRHKRVFLVFMERCVHFPSRNEAIPEPSNIDAHFLSDNNCYHFSSFSAISRIRFHGTR